MEGCESKPLKPATVRTSRDPVIIGITLGLIVLMFVAVIAISQIGSWQDRLDPWGTEPDWTKPLSIVDDAPFCPARSGVEWVFNHPHQRECPHVHAQPVISILDHSDPPWVYVKLSVGYGWTWWGQLKNG